MTQFDYDASVPATNDDPSVDQPTMQLNAEAIGGDFYATGGIIGVDHVTFNTPNGGQHTKVTYTAPTSGWVAAGTTTYGHTFPGTVTGRNELLFINTAGALPGSCIRAYTSFANAAVPTQINSFNVTSVTNVSSMSAQVYTITLPASVVTTSAAAIFISFSNSNVWMSPGTGYSSSFTAPVITFTVGISPTTPCTFSIMVLQF